jgi:FkbM family methyltransferase
METFGSEEALDKVVDEATTINIKFAGVPIELRILAKDSAAERLGDSAEDGAGYGLESLLDTRKGEKDMISMIDMGGNYGIVTIAVYNKFPGLLRTVVVEPVPTTYFFLRWNMHLNNVPSVSQKEFTKHRSKPGVVALNGGVRTEPGEIQMCLHPEWSMNARMMNDQALKDGGDCDCSKLVCATAPAVTTQSLFDDYFGEDTINLMKMDCEGCEFEILPFVREHSSRVTRLVGELHLPEEQLIDTACLYDKGQYLTKVCRVAEWEWVSSLPLGCDDAGRKACRWQGS